MILAFFKNLQLLCKMFNIHRILKTFDQFSYKTKDDCI